MPGDAVEALLRPLLSRRALDERFADLFSNAKSFGPRSLDVRPHVDPRPSSRGRRECGSGPLARFRWRASSPEEPLAVRRS